MRDVDSVTVEGAAAWAREDPQVDRPTLGEVLADERRCSVCGLRPVWDDEGDPCDDCEREAVLVASYDWPELDTTEPF